jgi:hypothetical protein
MRLPFTLPEFVAQQDSFAEVGLLKELGRVNFNRLLRGKKNNSAKIREVAEGSEKAAFLKFAQLAKLFIVSGADFVDGQKGGSRGDAKAQWEFVLRFLAFSASLRLCATNFVLRQRGACPRLSWE